MKEMSLCGFCGSVVEEGRLICPRCGSVHRDFSDRKTHSLAWNRLQALESSIEKLEAELEELSVR